MVAEVDVVREKWARPEINLEVDLKIFGIGQMRRGKKNPVSRLVCMLFLHKSEVNFVIHISQMREFHR